MTNITEDEIKRYQKHCVQNGAWHSCLNCDWWIGEQCSFFEARPPAEVIVHGCEYWEQKIPF